MGRLKIALIAGALVLCGSALPASAQNLMLEYDGGIHEYFGNIYSLVVNNQLLDPPLSPIIFNDHALVPVREIFEEMGAEVAYNEGTVEVRNDETYVRMNINDNIAYVNGKKTKIPDNVVPKLISKLGGETKTMVPVRFISETLGMDVEFSSEYAAIIISGSDNDADYEYVEDYTVDYTEESYEPEETISYEEYIAPKEITDVTYEAVSADRVRIYVTTTAGADATAFSMSSPDRVVVDFEGFSMAPISDIRVNEAGVTSVRFGNNGERARIVADISGEIGSYEVSELSDTQSVIDITTKYAPVITPAPVTAVLAASSSEKSAQSTNTANTAAPTSSDASKLIILDAGHGGSDSGAVGELNGIPVYEKNLTLSITYKVKDILESKGYTTLMTRTGDTLPSLTERPAMANESGAAIFVSIHINSCDSEEPNGVEVYYSLENNSDSYGTTSEVFAENLLNRMQKYMQANNRGVKTANHAVTRRCKMPASLVEVGFISNTHELELMTSDDYQQKAAQGIAEGIMVTLEDITVPDNE